MTGPSISEQREAVEREARPHRLSYEVATQLRAMVNVGERRRAVALKLGVHINTVDRYAAMKQADFDAWHAVVLRDGPPPAGLRETKYNGIFVTSDGEVWSLANPRRPFRKATSLGRAGYPSVSIEGKSVSVHVLVAETFWGPRPSRSHEVCHADGNPMNNRADNLRWGTRADNAEDRRRHGRQVQGERQHCAKLTAEQVLEIRRLRGRKSQRQIAAAFGVHCSTIYKIQTLQAWGHIAIPQEAERKEGRGDG